MLKRFVSKIKVESPPGEKKAVVNAYNQECFFVHDGAVLGNLKDLLRALTYMTEAQFSHHVSAEKNDFANWVKDVLKDEACALAISKTKTAKKMADVIERRLKDYYL